MVELIAQGGIKITAVDQDNNAFAHSIPPLKVTDHPRGNGLADKKPAIELVMQRQGVYRKSVFIIVSCK